METSVYEVISFFQMYNILMTLKNQIINGVSPPGHIFHYSEGRYTLSFCVKMKKITARIREKNSQAKLTKLLSLTLCEVISWP